MERVGFLGRLVTGDLRFLQTFKRPTEDGGREDDLYYVSQAKALRLERRQAVAGAKNDRGRHCPLLSTLCHRTIKLLDKLKANRATSLDAIHHALHGLTCLPCGQI